MANFHNVAMHAEPPSELPRVGEGLEEEREGEVIGTDGVLAHVGIHPERNVRGAGQRKGSDESVADEDMGPREVGEEGQRQVREAERVADVDEARREGGARAEV